MKYRLPISTLALLLASTAVLAQDRPLTREEVKAEAARARDSGQLDDPMRHDYSGWWDNRSGAAAGAQGRSAEASAAPQAGTGKTRAEVKEELRRARESGELDRLERSYGY
ncbi:DUF4148 domain-containing protein [uncultured Azohydromonas sp.]|jgi:hypothetical protein|uniref:DUF4148 domain-containing protein n=1 Tax=uncultured Azohydromonas sp. TaxID=487342 RepID=UPI002603AF70|nr:DUF4148 domain-containing protein [uncultured Azohydromonas sp.]